MPDEFRRGTITVTFGLDMLGNFAPLDASGTADDLAAAVTRDLSYWDEGRHRFHAEAIEHSLQEILTYCVRGIIGERMRNTILDFNNETGQWAWVEELDKTKAPHVTVNLDSDKVSVKIAVTKAD